MNMHSTKGFSLIEMQVSLIVASILILAVGVLSSMSTRSYNKIQNQAEAYNDVSYALKMMQNKVRSAASAPVVDTSKNPAVWLEGKQLVVDNGAFGIYQQDENSIKEFVYLSNKNDDSQRETIFKFEKNKDALDWKICSKAEDQNCLNYKTEEKCDSIFVKFSDEKGNPFNLSSCILRRVG